MTRARGGHPPGTGLSTKAGGLKNQCSTPCKRGDEVDIQLLHGLVHPGTTVVWASSVPGELEQSRDMCIFQPLISLEIG